MSSESAYATVTRGNGGALMGQGSWPAARDRSRARALGPAADDFEAVLRAYVGDELH